MIRALRHIIRGCGYIEGYGSHPGTSALVLFVLLGGWAGMKNGGWRGSLFGAAVMGSVSGAFYLCGAWSRGRAAEQRRSLLGSRHEG